VSRGAAGVALALALAAGCGDGDGEAAPTPAPPLEAGGWVLQSSNRSGNTGETVGRWYIDGASGDLDFVWATSLDGAVYWACLGTIDAVAIGELTALMNQLGLLGHPDALADANDRDVGHATYSVLATGGAAAGLRNGVQDHVGALRDLGDAMFEIAAEQTGCTEPP